MKKQSVISQGAAGPNLNAVEALYLRAKAFEEGQLSTTGQIYKPINDHEESHRKAIELMTEAVRRGDTEAIEKYFKEAQYHAQMQVEAGNKALNFYVKRAAQRAHGEAQVQG